MARGTAAAEVGACSAPWLAVEVLAQPLGGEAAVPIGSLLGPAAAAVVVLPATTGDDSLEL
jgi:hypothetical protein